MDENQIIVSATVILALVAFVLLMFFASKYEKQEPKDHDPNRF